MAFAGLDLVVFQTGQYKAPRRQLTKRGSPLRYTHWLMAHHAQVLDIEKDLLSLLTPEPGRQRCPAWSPDERWVYYVADDEEGNWSIFRRRADRGGAW